MNSKKRTTKRTGLSLIAVIVYIFCVTGTTAEAAPYRGYDGSLVSLSPSRIRIAEGASITVEARIKNTGTATWQRSGNSFVALNAAEPFYRTSLLEHDFWLNAHQPAKLSEANVAPGNIGTFRFALHAPLEAGVYTESFMLSSENTAWLRESIFSITLIVGSVDEEVLGLSSDPTLEEQILSEIGAASTSTPTSTSAIGSKLSMDEPSVRVGLYSTIDPVIITADTMYQLEDENGTVIIVLPSKHVSVAYFDALSKSFLISTAGTSFQLTSARFTPTATSTIFTLVNYDNPSKWQADTSDNRFRGSIELQYGSKSGKPWVINEVLMEDYLKGIKETSDVSPQEYQKAIAVAARSYAIWHLLDGKKHVGNNFTLDAVYDQVYRGVNTEELVPNFSKAVEETHGIVVLYDDQIAFTPYFAQSDGRTRTVKEAWGGANMPHLVSVADPTNTGLKLWGHGVGMSARGALIMASRYASTFEEILNHYYTDVVIEQRYVRGVHPEMMVAGQL